MLFGRLFDRSAHKRRLAVESVYGDVVARARDPHLYDTCDVPDTFDGRFEMMVWHLAFIVRRLRGGGEAQQDFSQELFDRFLDDMDRSMREAAVGDIAIPKRLKKMVRVWFGRIRALDELDGQPTLDKLEPILQRNLYPDADEPPSLRRLAGMLLDRMDEAERAQPSDIVAGRSPYLRSEQAA